jgi:hypothetical protein
MGAVIAYGQEYGCMWLSRSGWWERFGGMKWIGKWFSACEVWSYGQLGSHAHGECLVRFCRLIRIALRLITYCN